MSPNHNPDKGTIAEKIFTLLALEDFGSPGADILELIEQQEVNASEKIGFIPGVPILRLVSSVWMHDTAEFSNFLRTASLGLPSNSPCNYLPVILLHLDERDPSAAPVYMAATLHLGGILEKYFADEDQSK